MISRRAAIVGVAASTLARPALGQPGLRALTDLARRAAIFATPTYETYRRRWRETVDPDNPKLLKLNQLDLAAAPNALEFAAWVDLSSEPMFLTLPDMDSRAYCFAIVDMLGDTIDQVSRRRYGRRALPHVLFGPSWTNPPPSGVRAVYATTNLVRLVGRISVDGPADLVVARALKVLFETPAARNERRVLESRELMPSGTVIPEEPFASWPEPVPGDPWDLMVVAARVLGEGPVPDRDAALVEEFAALKLRPRRRFDLLGFSPAERAAMLEGIERARAEIGEAAGKAIRRVGGWRYPPVHPGDFGEDRLQRAVVATIDPFMPETAESMTLVADADSTGATLDGAHRYALRFANGPPPSRAVWSIAAGGEPIGGLRREAEEVEIVRRGSGHFAIDLQIWQPTGALLEGTWKSLELLRIQ